MDLEVGVRKRDILGEVNELYGVAVEVLVMVLTE